MKISFENENHNLNNISHNEQVKAHKSQAGRQEAATMGSYMVSFGESRNLIGSYNDKKQNSELTEAAAASDVSLKRKFMSVMSLSMSDADYAELARTGKVPEDMDVSDSVTILDEIKTALIKGGTNVAGYTDDISKEAIEEITGSSAVADELIKSMAAQDVQISEKNIESAVEALEMAKTVLPISDSTTAFLLENSYAPTINNIYQAAHSSQIMMSSYSNDNNQTHGERFFSQDGYISKVTSGETADIDAIMPQIEETIRKSGLENNKETMEDALWLVKSGVGLTAENLNRLDSMRDIRNSIADEKIIDSISIAMSAGISAKDANLIYDESIYLSAERVIEEVESVEDSHLSYAISQGMELNLRNLGQIATADTIPNINESVDLSNPEMIKARRQLEEVRLSMTVEANRLLLRSNFQIDIEPMEKLVDALKIAEKQIAKQMFPAKTEEESTAKADIYRQIKSELPQIPYMPAALIGQMDEDGELSFGADKSFSLHNVYENGVSRREVYIKAGEQYEALMTAPRGDLGDNILKAFRNVDDILRDLNYETTDINRRAVRILGYNAMEITPENIERVAEADTNLRNTLEKMTPSRVLNMIRENVNPMTLTISELGNYLDEQESNPGENALEYARFLMQLERRSDITEEERSSYIGIYRMIKGIEKNDDAAVGNILNTGREMSFANLLSAVRTGAKPWVDTKVDDNFGGMISVRKNEAIDTQILTAFSQERGYDLDEEFIDGEIAKDITGRFVQAAQTSDVVIENLINSGLEVSLVNIEAMDAIRGRRGDWAKPLTQQFVDGLKFRDDFEEKVDEAIGEYVDEVTLYEHYNNMLDSAGENLTEMMNQADGVIDLRAIQSSFYQINLLKAASQNDTYDFPTVIDGELTSVRLTFRRNAGAGELMVSLETQMLGRIAGEFNFTGDRNGYIAYENDIAADRLENLKNELASALSFTPSLIKTEHINIDKYTDFSFAQKNSENAIKKDGDSADINNTELVRIAKSIIGIIRKI